MKSMVTCVVGGVIGLLVLSVISAATTVEEDIIYEDQTIIAPHPINDALFGNGVALDENPSSDKKFTLAVSATVKRVNGTAQAGSVYVYESNLNHRFQFVQELQRPDGKPKSRNDGFGNNLALCGDYLLISGIRTWAVYLFHRQDNTMKNSNINNGDTSTTTTSSSKWIHVQTFSAFRGGNEETFENLDSGFGTDIAMTKDVIAITSPSRGTVYVYYKDPHGHTFGSEQIITRSYLFGGFMAMDDSWLLASQSQEKALYIYEKDPTTGRFPNFPSARKKFRSAFWPSPILNPNYVLIDFLHIFDRATWSFVESIPEQPPRDGWDGWNGFPSNGAISQDDNNVIVIGDRLSNVSYVYAYNANSTAGERKWSLHKTLLSNRSETRSGFRDDVAVLGSTVVTGDTLDKNPNGKNGGAVRVYIIPSLLQPPLPTITTDLFLYDANTGARIQRLFRKLKDNNIYTSSSTSSFTVKAVPSDYSVVASVVFSLNDAVYFIDNQKYHFYMNGKTKQTGHLNAVPEFNIKNVVHKVTIQIYTERNGEGSLVHTVEREFMLI